MNIADEFRRCVEEHDVEGARKLFADDIVFCSPVVHKPYSGLDTIMFLLGHVEQTFENFKYVDQASDGNSHMLRFTANVGDKSLEGVDLLQTDDSGMVKNFTVMIRPLSGAIALAQAMGARIEAAGGMPAAQSD
ncbi:MAG: nuclear transport factor 2 family protein [Solirubrobacterales bacterium]|nr:nuclear transport factor 2 family protein [Solirubrobacterales bacterium]